MNKFEATENIGNKILKKLGVIVSERIGFDIKENIAVKLDGQPVLEIKKETIERFHEKELFDEVLINIIKINLGLNNKEKYIFEGTNGYDKLVISEKIKDANKDKRDSNSGEDSHYHKNNSIDPITFGKNNFSKEEMLGFYRMSAIKYITRYGKKNGYNSDDLNKAIDYIKYIKEMEME